MLIFPLWLFGSIAKAQFSRLWDGTDFRLLSFLIACVGLAAIVVAVATVFRAESDDLGNDGSNPALNTDAVRPQRAG